MPQDKSIISLPSTSKVTVLPNVAANIQQVKYNEGLYVTDSSLKATYPKSVIRIYKNPNNPKKVYFVAKDTSLLENYVFNLVDKGATKESVPNSFRVSDTQYYWSRTEDENSYRDFSIFSQPYNLDLESDVVGKQINFYSLPPASQQSLYMLGLNSDSDIDSYFIKYNIILKAKSYITDYQNYELFKSNKAKRAEASDVGGAEQPTVDKVALYEKFLFNNLTASTDIEKDLNNIKPLSESELQLNKSVNILNVNKIKFSDFIKRKYSNILLTNTNSFDNLNELRPKNSVKLVPENDGYVLFKSATDSFNSSVNTFNPIYISTFANEKMPSNINLPEPTINNSETEDSSLDWLDAQNIFIIKDNYLVPTIKDFQFIRVNDVDSYYRFQVNEDGFDYTNGSIVPDIISSTSISNEKELNEGVYEGTITFDSYKFFDYKRDLNLNFSDLSLDSRKSLSTGELTVTKINNSSLDYVDNENLISDLYIMDDSFNYNNYNFIPSYLDETIYEFEIDQELNFENGTFVVAEIE